LKKKVLDKLLSNDWTYNGHYQSTFFIPVSALVSLKKLLSVRVRILPYFQEEIMVQEDPIVLEKMMA